MPDWDKIYKEYFSNGKNWRDINDGVIPQCFINGINPTFKKLLKNTKFRKKYAFDIGCGYGKYLVYLASKDFNTDGIDASSTSVKMTKKILGDKSATIKKADMFNMKIIKNKYDLILSVSTINHGYKKDVDKLIKEIYQSLLPRGKTFITIPDKKCIKNWQTFKKHKIIDQNTVTPLIGPEKGIIHSFYTKKEILEMFKNFSKIKMETDVSGQWVITATK
ncbi:class I SAM-dependent methyltransferase [Patescibacteria group bacterium]|nr:class I SAM-dependent methyltransferase [Patescibacteria group bacterium]